MSRSRQRLKREAVRLKEALKAAPSDYDFLSLLIDALHREWERGLRSKKARKYRKEQGSLDLGDDYGKEPASSKETD